MWQRSTSFTTGFVSEYPIFMFYNRRHDDPYINMVTETERLTAGNKNCFLSEGFHFRYAQKAFGVIKTRFLIPQRLRRKGVFTNKPVPVQKKLIYVTREYYGVFIYDPGKIWRVTFYSGLYVG